MLDTYIDVLSDRMFLAVLVMLVALVCGVFAAFLPVVPLRSLMWAGIDRCVGGFAAKLNNPKRAASDLFIRGSTLSFVVMFLVWLAYRAGAYVWAGDRVFVELALLCVCTGFGGFSAALLRGQTLQSGDLFARLTGFRLKGQDEGSVNRASAMGSFVDVRDGLCVPIITYVVFGADIALLATVSACLGRIYTGCGAINGFSLLAGGLHYVLSFAARGFVYALLCVLSVPFWIRRRGQSSASGDRPNFYMGGDSLVLVSRILGVSFGGAYVRQSGAKVTLPWCGVEGGSARLPSGRLKYMFLLCFAVYSALLGVLLAGYISLN